MSFYQLNTRLGKLKVGDKVTSDFHNEQTSVIRTVTKVTKDKSCGSGYRVWADDGGKCPTCKKPHGTELLGYDGAWFIPVGEAPDAK